MTGWLNPAVMAGLLVPQTGAITAVAGVVYFGVGAYCRRVSGRTIGPLLVVMLLLAVGRL